ncbi:unnamed protein product, partial [marine sediment metagenome]
MVFVMKFDPPGIFSAKNNAIPSPRQYMIPIM